MTKRILIIVPAYNEEPNLERLVSSIRQIKSPKIEMVIINDCSSDSTALLCNKLGVEVVNLPCNLGIGGAVQTGYKYALAHGYDIAVQVDGDGQHNPEYLSKLIQPILNDEADMVIGSRYIEKRGFQSSYLRRVGIKYFSRLLYILTGQLIRAC